ncbi:DNA (cytosine-5-)-methyltransferase [Selenomonas noxia]|uniref:DNA cytosine methyltransferase n=1 Tax=Selenomonas noxia TaxID=135083 RepID=UPI0028E97159|nr:DNA (cytosine-5-)-methyltransferase [Selenomonas noxia]
MNSTAIDLFCGIGGLTKGLSLSGIHVNAGIDIDDSCRFAYEKNNDAQFINCDITSLDGNQLAILYPPNTIRILVGCAPCQPFSKYTNRYRKKGTTDDKWKLLYSFSRLIKEVHPEIVSMENVPELENETVFSDFVSVLENLKYHISWTIVYCPEYGVPQRRKRLVLLASLLKKINLIPPLYDSDHYPTVREAIGYLPALRSGEQDDTDSLHRTCRLSSINLKRIKQSVPGGTWRDWDRELQLKCHKKKSGKTYPSVYGRMRWDEPSPTITTQFYGYGNGRFGHPEQDRALSLREGAILQSFPCDYIFFDDDHPATRRELGIHIGNSVPVELGRAIGLSIQKHLQEVN